MKKLAERHLDRALDLLNERLAFEREGVAFYDKVLQVMRGLQDASVQMLLPSMTRFRDQKKGHEEWLEEQIRALGGDAHETTDLSRLVMAESEGLRTVIDGDFGVPHLFHALLQVELVDHAGWQLLLELADRADDAEAREAFRERLHEEEEHLDLVRQVVSRIARREVLGEEAASPPPGA